MGDSIQCPNERPLNEWKNPKKNQNPISERKPLFNILNKTNKNPKSSETHESLIDQDFSKSKIQVDPNPKNKPN